MTLKRGQLCDSVSPMDLSHPFRVVTRGPEGAILTLLARADKAFTGREVQRAIGSASQDHIRIVLRRLAEQGIVFAEPGGGRAILYRLNRDHLAAPSVEALANLRANLLTRLRQTIGAWEIQPVSAILFGSAARGDAGAESDLDVLIVRAQSVDADDDRWRDQIMQLEASATAWTGNDTRVLEYAENELPVAPGEEPAIDEALSDGIDLGGIAARHLRMRIGRGRRD